MSEKTFVEHPETPFPIGVEYYRAPIPKREVWDEDFARIHEGGFRIVRSFSYWNWMEPRPGAYELDDFDRLFDLAEKHGLFVWMDITLATHGACPGWLTREYPDIRAVDRRGALVRFQDPGLGEALHDGVRAGDAGEAADEGVQPVVEETLHVALGERGTVGPRVRAAVRPGRAMPGTTRAPHRPRSRRVSSAQPGLRRLSPAPALRFPQSAGAGLCPRRLPTSRRCE